MSPERLYEMWRRPGDPHWAKLPYSNVDAQRQHGTFGKEHFLELARKEAS